MTNKVINTSEFTVTVNKIGAKILDIKPITVKNQIEEIRSIDDVPKVNTSLRVDGATLIYNSSTGEYDVKLSNIVNDFTITGNLIFSTIDGGSY